MDKKGIDYEKMYKEAVIKMRLFFKKYNGLVISEDGTMYKDLLEIFPDIARLEDGQLLEFLADLAKDSVWHNADEEPQIGRNIVMCHYDHMYSGEYLGERFFDREKRTLMSDSKWAYFDDLLKL